MNLPFRRPAFGGPLLRIVAIVLTLCLVTFISVQQQISNDFWLQAKVGELIVRDRAIPSTLLFPFTEVRNQQFNSHEWLPSIAFHVLINLVGEAGLPLVLGAAGVGLFLMVTLLASTRLDGNAAVALLMGLIAMAVENYRHFLRPELFSLYFLVLFLMATERYRANPKWQNSLVLASITTLWVNCHASFVLAPVILSCYAMGLWLERYFRVGKQGQPEVVTAFQFLKLIAFCGLAVLVNPRGSGIFTVLVEMQQSTLARQYIMEWASTWDSRMHATAAWWIGILCAVIVLACALLHARRGRFVETLIALAFLVLAMQAVRFFVYLGIIAGFIMPTALPRSLLDKRLQIYGYGLLAALASFFLIFTIRFGNVNGDFPHKSQWHALLTVPMVRFLDNKELVGNVYTSYDYGAELVYRAWPRLKPSIDSRIDSYGDDYFSYHERLLHEKNAMRDFVGAYDVGYMLLTVDDFRLLSKQGRWINDAWVLRAYDNHAVFLERTSK